MLIFLGTRMHCGSLFVWGAERTITLFRIEQKPAKADLSLRSTPEVKPFGVLLRLRKNGNKPASRKALGVNLGNINRTL